MAFEPVSTADEATRLVETYPFPWHHRYEIYPGVYTPGSYQPAFLLNLLQLGEVRGKRVLDVGSSNGFYSRELDRMGAEVVAFDYRAKDVAGFDRMEACYGKTIRHVNANVFDIRKLDLGTFDIVLFLGVLYHVADMVKTLWDLRSVCRDLIYVETHIEEFDGDTPAARYFHGKSFLGDLSSYWGPNEACVDAMLRDVGVEALSREKWGNRLLIRGKVGALPSEKIPLAYGRMAYDAYPDRKTS